MRIVLECSRANLHNSFTKHWSIENCEWTAYSSAAISLPRRKIMMWFQFILLIYFRNQNKMVLLSIKKTPSYFIFIERLISQWKSYLSGPFLRCAKRFVKLIFRSQWLATRFQRQATQKSTKGHNSVKFSHSKTSILHDHLHL